jgi:hypothetical protein
MTRVVDLVNFNADASCLRAADWLAALGGGERSCFCRWLGVYLQERRPVVMGFTGATVADLAELNPEAIDLVNAHPEIFEVVLRPFSHDIALLRSPAGFALNVHAGRAAIEHAFHRVTPYYLPAEFMLTNAQVYHLEQAGVRGTFVNAARFKDELRARIPDRPYLVRGIFGSSLRCIPINGVLSDAYLKSLHLWDVVAWNQTLAETAGEVTFSWRDGESFLFVPDGIQRERAWLQGESREVERAFLRDVDGSLAFDEPDAADTRVYRSYPVHSFSDWFREFRMLGFIDRLAAIEQRIDAFDTTATALWLQAINSDVFSAVEKDSPVITLRTAPNGDRKNREISWTIQRSERGFEGEEYLEILGAGPDAARLIADATGPHIEKLRARRRYLEKTVEVDRRVRGARSGRSDNVRR